MTTKKEFPPVTLASPYTCPHCGRAASIREWVNNDRKCLACGTLAFADVKTALTLKLRRARRHESPTLTPVVIGGDHEHGLLPKFAGNDFRDTLGAAEDVLATMPDGGRSDFDDQGVFPLALPNTPSAGVRRARKRTADQPLHLVHERFGIERSGQSPVPTRLAGYATPDEEPDGAHGLEVSPAGRSDVPPPYRSLADCAHEASVTRDPKLDTRRYGTPSWIRFEVESKNTEREDEIRIETCWLPDLPEIRRALPTEFVRQDDGTYVAYARDNDEMKLVRLATKALHAILREMRGENDG